MAIYTIYTGFTKFINHILYICVFEILLYTLTYVKEKIYNTLILENDDKKKYHICICILSHPNYVFELKTSIMSKCSTSSNNALQKLT